MSPPPGLIPPPWWTEEQLGIDRDRAVENFRRARMEEPLEAYLEAFEERQDGPPISFDDLKVVANAPSLSAKKLEAGDVSERLKELRVGQDRQRVLGELREVNGRLQQVLEGARSWCGGRSRR